MLCVILGLALEGASLYCLSAMWAHGRLQENVKYEVIDRIIYWPKLLMLPLGAALIAISISWLGGTVVFLIALLFWIVITRILAMTIAQYFMNKKRVAKVAKATVSVRADPTPPSEVARPLRERARSIDLRKYQKPK